MTITPVGRNIYIQMDQVKQVGDLHTDSKKTIHESATILAVGSDVMGSFNVGDIILVKGWAIDSVTYNKETFFFINEDSNGICAVVTT